MREIKFRAWDNVGFEMLYAGEEIDVIFTLDSSGIECVDVRNGEPTGTGVDSMDHLVYMQYTGLRDKNGVDVYQGDIVKCQQGCPHEVIWLEEYAGIYIGGMPAWYLKGLKEGYAWSGDEEVIGNIYENPELLEVGSNERD